MKWPSLRPHYSGNLTKLQAEVFKQQSSLDCPRQHVPHRLRCLSLCCAGDMGVGVQGESCREVAQHSGHGFHIHPVLQCQGGEGVAQVVESHLGQSCPFQHSVEHMQHTVRGDWPAIGGRKHPGTIAHRSCKHGIVVVY